MNWVGGVRIDNDTFDNRNRIRVKQERKIQKEFFERKRLSKKFRSSSMTSPKDRRSQGTSQDLLSLQVLLSAHGPRQTSRKDAGKNKILRQKAGSKRWIPAARDPKQTDLSHNAALSLSPCQTPSQLDLDFPAATPEPDDTSSSLQSGTHKNDLYGSAPSSDCVQWNGDCMQELPSGKGPERLFSQEKIVSEDDYSYHWKEPALECFPGLAALDPRGAPADNKRDGLWRAFVKGPTYTEMVGVARLNRRVGTMRIESDGPGEMSMTEKATMGEQLWRLTSSIDTPCADSSIHGPSPALPKDPDLQLDAPQVPSSLLTYDEQAQVKEVLDEVLDLERSEDDFSGKSDSAWSFTSSSAVSDADHDDLRREKVPCDAIEACGVKLKFDNYTDSHSNSSTRRVSKESVKEEMKGKMERRQADVVQPSLENVLYCRETIESLLTPQSAPQQSTWCAGGSLCQQSVANTQKKYEESWTQTDDIMETLSSEGKGTTDKKNDGVVLTKDNGRTSAGKLCPTRGGDSSSIVCLQKRISELENTNIYQSLIIRILRQL